MRSRYTAYTRGQIDYVAGTLAAEKRDAFDVAAARTWAAQATWIGLRVLSAERGQPSDCAGVVAFIATYRQGDRTIEHHEVSQFRRGEGGAWRFVEGDTQARVVERRPDSASPPAVARRATKIGRNDPCPCGSGRKYKTCCGA